MAPGNARAELLDELDTYQAEMLEAQSVADQARQVRDDAIREAIAEGVTMYAIAKRIGLTEQAIAKIRDRG